MSAPHYERLVSVIGESRVEMLAKQHGIRQKRDDGGVKKTLATFISRADEGKLSHCGSRRASRWPLRGRTRTRAVVKIFPSLC
jgi:hypothetical protein